MENYVIKASGTMEEITKELNTLKAVFGKDATLPEMATATRFARIETAVRKQFEKVENAK
jgi:hypothetical protein